MTSASDTIRSLPTDTAPLRAKWGWILALGIVYVIAGFVALGSVMMATVASVFIVGVMMIVAGVAEIINAFQCKGWGRFLVWVLLGALYIIAGFVTFENPLFAAAILTLLLGASLVASGIVRIFLAFSMKREQPWIWLLLSSIVTLAARVADPGTLADQQRLCSRNIFGHRPRHGGRRLDRSQPRAASARRAGVGGERVRGSSVPNRSSPHICRAFFSELRIRRTLEIYDSSVVLVRKFS